MLKISLSGATVSEVAGQKILSQRITAGFKIVFDNIDLTVRPRHTTEERQSLSLHNVNAYAVKDRVDYSTFQVQETKTKIIYMPFFQVKKITSR